MLDIPLGFYADFDLVLSCQAVFPSSEDTIIVLYFWLCGGTVEEPSQYRQYSDEVAGWTVRSCIPGRGKGIYFIPSAQIISGLPSSLVVNGYLSTYQGMKRSGREAPMRGGGG